MKTETKHPNSLLQYRRRLGYTQEQVAQLLGLKSRSLLSRMELGHSLPRLLTALQLAVLYRVPVDFLYYEIYLALRDEIRAREQMSAPPHQGVLAFAT